MGDELPDWSGRLSELARLQAESDRNRIKFLHVELQTGFAFASLAETDQTRGNPERATKSLADAERAYATLDRFMSDPKHARHITEEQHMELRAGMDRLRATLDTLARPV